MILLCIDDDPEDIELFQDAVRTIDKRHVCVAAGNGCEALKLLSLLMPDYIFLDINMPVMDGKETLTNIRLNERFRAVPVCILSTSVDQREAETYKMLGADKCLVKPNSFGDLIVMLRTILN
jgi:CheY-like chemotaxis protein